MSAMCCFSFTLLQGSHPTHWHAPQSFSLYLPYADCCGLKGLKWGCQSGNPGNIVEYSRNMVGMYLPGSLYCYCYYILGVPTLNPKPYSWGSLFGIPFKSLELWWLRFSKSLRPVSPSERILKARTPDDKEVSV